MHELLAQIAGLAGLDAAERVAAYNALSRAAAELVADLVDAPALAPQLVPADALRANDYNPNTVASPEMDLLEESIRADGVTMPVVVMETAPGLWTVIDGFHRRRVITEKLGGAWIPCSIIQRGPGERMASTVRHNRARGKHQIDLMAALVKGMMDLEWDDATIARSLGMSEEELLRLRQTVGAAPMLASAEYSRAWGVIP